MNTSSPRTVVVGTGAIGHAVTRALLSHARPVRVWNRSAERVTDLVADGADHVVDLVGAVRSSDLTIVCLTDYAAARDVLEPVLAAGDVPAGRTLVMLTTGTPDDARGLAERLRAIGVDFVDAGVQTSPDDVGSPRATFLFSGSERGYAAHHETLDLLGTGHWLGEDPAAAAVWDLALFGVWYDAQVGLLRAFEVLGGGSAPDAVEQFAEAASRQLGHVVDEAVATAREVVDSDYPRGPATLDEHLPVLSQLRESRRGTRLGDGGIGDVEALVATLAEDGHGDLGLTAVIDADLTPARNSSRG